MLALFVLGAQCNGEFPYFACFCNAALLSALGCLVHFIGQRAILERHF